MALILLLSSVAGFSQAIAPNIGFESGNFDNWVRSFGTIDTLGNVVVYEGVPYSNPFKIYGPQDSSMVDWVGNFPVRSPNGSKYSVILGDTLYGNSAQRLSYTFTVPVSASSIVFDYAVVLQNPKHSPNQQPRFTVKVFDLSDSTYLGCPSFDFISSDNLPGFKEVGDIFYKDWSAATIDLKNYIGKTVRLEFTVNHCSFGAHFGYAYLDIEENLGTAITGNAYCKQQNTVTLNAPVGFATYTWFSGDLKSQVGNSRQLTLSPPPPDKSVYAAVVTPYDNIGCADTLYTTVNEIDNEFNLKVVDTVYGCPGSSVDLTAASVTAGTDAGTTFAYFTDAAADSTLAYPDHVSQPGTYYIQGTSSDGCTGLMPVYVQLAAPVLRITNPPAIVYPSTVDLSSTFTHQPNVTYSYYSDAAGADPLAAYKHVAKGGTYYVRAVNNAGCAVTQSVTVVINSPPYSITAPNTFTPNGDGINDHFNLTLKGYVTFGSMRIYDRYGTLVYTSTGAGLYWDGNRNGRPLPGGVYYWLFEGENSYNHTTITEGASITLIR